jgi:hypothetical protein
MMKARERRARSPAFKAEIAKENAEFKNVLAELGQNTWNTGVNTLLKTPYHLLVNALKAMHSKKYNAGDYSKDALKLFFGKNGVAHDILKVTANAIHLVAKGAKIGVRQLFKL